MTDWLARRSRRQDRARPRSSADEFTDARPRSCCPGTCAGGSTPKRPRTSPRPRAPSVPIDYEAEEGPKLAIRVQELFGLDRHPAIAGGRVPLVIELLSPAHRPVQVTRDLPRLLARQLCGGQSRDEGPLSAPPLARRPAVGPGDPARQAARAMRFNFNELVQRRLTTLPEAQLR